MKSRSTATHSNARALLALPWIGGLLVMAGCASPASEPPPAGDQRVERQADSPEFEPMLFLDVRSQAAYLDGHLQGAVHVDPEEWKSESLSADNGLANTAFWHQRIGEMGIRGDETVMIYDDGRMTDSARVWFILQHLGVPNTAVVNGGWPTLQERIAERKLTISREPTVPQRAEFQPMTNGDDPIELIGRQDLRDAVDRGAVQVLDARSPSEFTGQDPRTNPRAGHLPGAINIPHDHLLDDQGRLRTPDELTRLFEDAGFRRGVPIVTHCDGGGRASLAALAASRAGFGPVKNYYLSFGDWSADATCPMVGPGAEQSPRTRSATTP